MQVPQYAYVGKESEQAHVFLVFCQGW